MVKIKENTPSTLSSLQKKILPLLTLPMVAECPTTLRYALAKYDADAVEEAYKGLYELWRQNHLTEE